MVANSRKTQSVGRSYQPLNMPIPIQVSTELDGQLASVVETDKDRPIASRVEQVIDLWEIEDEWWRKKPIQRRYFRLLMGTGRVMTIFKDLSSGEWFRQEY